ncbi:MAG: hypothetical protein ACOYIH_06060 [Candidatus Fimadaptatus sp.]|jgi:hypothetical protein
MKRLIATLLAAMMLISMPALADDADGKQDEAQQSELKMVPFADASARDTELMLLADEMTMQMAALGSTQGYVKMMTLSDEIQGVVNEIVAHDYSAPRRSMVIFMEKDSVDALGKIVMDASGVKFDEDNAGMSKIIFGRALASIGASILAEKSSDWLAVGSIIAANKARIVKDVPAGIAYVVNDYGEGVPYSWTSFEVGEDGAALISSRYVHESSEKMKQLFEESGSLNIPGMDMDIDMPPMPGVLYDRAEDKAE